MLYVLIINYRGVIDTVRAFKSEENANSERDRIINEGLPSGTEVEVYAVEVQ